MNRLRLFIALTIAALALAGGHAAPSAQARTLQAPAAQTTAACTVATLHTGYDFLVSQSIVVSPGTVIAIPDELFYTSPVPYAARGTIHFDGAGNVLLRANATGAEHSAAPTDAPTDAPTEQTGLYSVEGCMVTAVFANGSQLDMRILKSDARHVPVSLTPGFVILRAPHSAS